MSDSDVCNQRSKKIEALNKPSAALGGFQVPLNPTTTLGSLKEVGPKSLHFNSAS